MIKNLVLIRHAKSDWNNSSINDHERTLNIRGKRDIPIMASFLIRKYPQIEYAISSDSIRTIETINSLNKYGYTLPEIHFTKNLYLAEIPQFEAELSGLSDEMNNVAICAHNPGIPNFVVKLCGPEINEIPSLGIVWIELDLDSWSEIFTAKGKIIRFDYPKKK